MFTCPACSGEMKPLFSSFFCPKECDKKPAATGNIKYSWKDMVYEYRVYTSLPPQLSNFVSFWWLMDSDDEEFAKKQVKEDFPYFHKLPTSLYDEQNWGKGMCAIVVLKR